MTITIEYKRADNNYIDFEIQNLDVSFKSATMVVKDLEENEHSMKLKISKTGHSDGSINGKNCSSDLCYISFELLDKVYKLNFHIYYYNSSFSIHYKEEEIKDLFINQLKIINFDKFKADVEFIVVKFILESKTPHLNHANNIKYKGINIKY